MFFTIVSLLLIVALLTFPISAFIKNFDFVSEGIYRGADLSSEDDYKFLRSKGIDVVVNLRLFTDDEKLCEKYDLDCRHYGITLLPIPFTDYFFNYDTLKEAFKTVIKENANGYNIFFHCYAGKDRTGALASAILLRWLACGLPYDKVDMKKILDKELTRFGFKKNIYPFLYKNIMAWADNLPDWICEEYE
jgi:hypothetical protein